MTDLGGANSFALGINDRGQVVGEVWPADSCLPPPSCGRRASCRAPEARGQLRRRGGHQRARPDRGAVAERRRRVPRGDVGQGRDHGPRSLGGYSVAYSVNARAMACGFSNLSERRVPRGALRGRRGRGPGHAGRHVQPVPARGQQPPVRRVVDDPRRRGQSRLRDPRRRDDGPEPADSADSGWVLNYAYGINKRGQIVGGGHRAGVVPIRAYLISPSGQQDDGDNGDGEGGDGQQATVARMGAAGSAERSRAARHLRRSASVPFHRCGVACYRSTGSGTSRSVTMTDRIASPTRRVDRAAPRRHERREIAT